MHATRFHIGNAKSNKKGKAFLCTLFIYNKINNI